MAVEIKVGNGLQEQVNALKSCASGMSSCCSVSVDGGSKLPTCNGYRDRIKRIAKLMQDFARLIEKDCNEVTTFIEDMEKTDRG